MTNTVLYRIGLFSLLLLGIQAISVEAQSVKVYILAGQSNMQGQGDIQPNTLVGSLSQFMANNPAASEFSYLQDTDGNWIERDDVWYRHIPEEGPLQAENLSIGLGASENQIGPELSFGHLIGEPEESRILLIKTAWGGKSLAVDFRPPSSGGTTGAFYNQMITDINDAITNIEEDFPSFEAGEIEIAGFCWFQGWNDGDEIGMAQEYEQNLNNLITDVRTDLQVPDLPFVVALTGHGGYDLEPEGTWLGNLQRIILPAQISAIENGGHENVAYVDTRDYWPNGELSPEPDFGFHWYNNAEGFLRIGAGLANEMMVLTGTMEEEEEEASNEPQAPICNCGMCGSGGSTAMMDHSEDANGVSCLGSIRPNTNLALPASYNYQEYVFPEPDDQGVCLGIENASAEIEAVYIAQTHRHRMGDPLLFTIGERPALFQMAITGTGSAPDVQVEGILNGTSLGALCLNGPAILSETIDLTTANFEEYFSVTLPKAWVQIGLELRLTAGDATQVLTQDDLLIRPYTELNLVLLNMDIMDYNQEPHRTPIFDNFLQEVASAIPASVIRFGQFPGEVRMPSFAMINNEGNTVVVSTDDSIGDNALNTGNVNFYANYVVDRVRYALGDTPNTIYFGNTLNLDPGGWGGNGSFVSFEYNDVFLHELGHALSLPHWVEDYRLENPEPWQYAYPFTGEEGEASGRGNTWNFIQATYEFVSPTCEDNSGIIGTERSDAMQRGYYCAESRTGGRGPWDGFGAFSAMAMSNYLLGSTPYGGQVEDRGEVLDFHFRENDGYPIASLVNGERVFTRHPSQPQNTFKENDFRLPGKEQIEQDAYLIYGSAHATNQMANIIYEPIRYTGTILPTIDPTDPEMFTTLKNLNPEDAPEFYGRARDITLKLTYIDGSVRHVIVPFHSFARPADFPDETPWPEYFAISVPADDLLCGVEMYHRNFIILENPDDQELGNINDPLQNITAENFMDAAVLMASLDHSCNCPGTPSYIEPGTSCDDGNPLTTNDIEDGFCNCEGTPVAPCGLIQNSSFDESTSRWWTWGTETTFVDGQAMFVINNIDDAGIAQGPLSLEAGETYDINFDAYASSARGIVVRVFLDQDPYTLYYEVDVDLTSGLQSYQLSFDMVETQNNCAIEFYIGGSDATVYIDDVCMDNACGMEEIENNGIDDDCDPETLDNPTTTSVSEVPDFDLEEDAIVLYPNPALDHFTISGNSDDYTIELVGLDGNTLMDLSSVSLPYDVNIEGLPSGLIFIKILNETNQNISVETIVKQ